MYCSLVQAWVSIIAIDLECLCLLCYNYSAALGIVETTKAKNERIRIQPQCYHSNCYVITDKMS